MSNFSIKVYSACPLSTHVDDTESDGSRMGDSTTKKV